MPGRKALVKSNMEYELILVDTDTIESPIELPKKSKNTTIQEKRKGIL